MRRTFLTGALTLGLVLSGSSLASASIIFDAGIAVTGSGLGAVATLVTGHETGGPSANGVEGNCVQWIGGADVFGTCPGITEADSGGLGGAGTKLLGADLGATQAGDVGVVLNLSETGQDLTVTLTAMTLIFYNAAGAQVGQFFLDPSLVGSTYTSGEGTGLGGSGFVFHLDAAQAAAANLLNATRVGGGFMVTGFNDGQETMYVFNIPTGGTPVPEPASLLLFGTGLAGVGRMLRRRMKNQRAA